MTSTLKLASWNIAGGHTIKSDKRFDYNEKEDAEYFIGHLKKLDADVVCLQESHWHPTKSLSQRIAAALGYGYVFETINSPSGVDAEYKESMAILSKFSIEQERAICLPYPSFDLLRPDGSIADRWDKYLQTCRVKDIPIGNIHTQPSGYFGYDYREGKGAEYAEEIERVIMDEMNQSFILAGDLNTPYADQVYANLFQSNQLRDALPIHPTKPDGNHIDYILHTSNISKVDATITKTDTDHYLCSETVAIQDK